MKARGFAKGSPAGALVVAFCDTTPPLIKAELRRRCSYYIYKITRLKRRRERGARVNLCEDVELATKALVVSKLMVIFHAGHGKL